jgi:hypothetical protein
MCLEPWSCSSPNQVRSQSAGVVAGWRLAKKSQGTGDKDSDSGVGGKDKGGGGRERGREREREGKGGGATYIEAELCYPFAHCISFFKADRLVPASMYYSVKADVGCLCGYLLVCYPAWLRYVFCMFGLKHLFWFHDKNLL